MNKIKIINEETFKEMRISPHLLRVQLQRPQTALSLPSTFQKHQSTLSEEHRLKKMIKQGLTVTHKKNPKTRTLAAFKTQQSQQQWQRSKTYANFNFQIKQNKRDGRKTRQSKNGGLIAEYKNLIESSRNKSNVNNKGRVKTENGYACLDEEKKLRGEIGDILKTLQEENNLCQARKDKKLIEMSRMKFSKYWMKHKLLQKQDRNGNMGATKNKLYTNVSKNQFS